MTADMTAFSSFSLILLLYLACSVNTVSATIHPTVIDITGVRFGSVETLISTYREVYHMEPDLAHPAFIIYSDRNSLATTDGATSTILAGAAGSAGYSEGTSSSARFNLITGFHQLSPAEVIIADKNNHCLRFLYRQSGRTGWYMGRCGIPGHRDGVNPLFYHPHSIIQHPENSHLLLVSEESNSVIRSVDTIKKTVTTFISSGLPNPRGMRVRFDTSQLLITTNTYYIRNISLQSQKIEILAGNTSRGHQDGALKQAKFYNVPDVLEIAEDVLVAADTDLHTVRILDLHKSTVTSLCNPGSSGHVDGTVQECQLYSPWSVLLQNNTLYIGEDQRIRKVKILVNECLSSVCHPDAKCTDLDPGYSCACNPGYTGDGEECKDIDECLTSPCHADATCTNLSPDFTCTCNQGFQGDGYNCLDVDECEAGSHNCDPHANCDNTEGGFTCSCKTGYYGTGVNCTEQDTCPDENIMLMADRKTKTGLFTLQFNGDDYELTLPVGRYTYTIRKAGKTCPLHVNILDSYVMKRVEFKAEYDVKCSLVKSPDTRKYLETVISRRYLLIKEICAGGCDKPSNLNASLTCSRDVLTVTWPTDKIIPGDSVKIPGYLYRAIYPTLSRYNSIFELVVFTYVPPLIFPRINKDGRAVRTVLTPTCADGRTYQATSGACV